MSETLEFFLDRKVTVHIAGLRVSGILRGFSEGQGRPHTLILETGQGPVIVRGSWLKITSGE